jgi:hypothetical protein
MQLVCRIASAAGQARRSRQSQQLQAGDRVHVIDMLNSTAAGRRGMVIRVSPSAPDVYEVRIDGEAFLRILPADALALVPPSQRP